MGALKAGHVETGRVAVRLEPGQTPGFRLVAIDREGFIIAPARMGNMINTSAEGPPAPTVENVEGQRGIDRVDRMQGHGGLPGLVADPATETPLVSVFCRGIVRPLQVTA